MKKPLGALFTVAAFVVGVTNCQGQQQDDLDAWNLIRQTHSASIQAIRTASCKIAHTATRVGGSAGIQSHTTTAWYWASPEAIRIKASTAQQDIDRVWKNGIRTAVVKLHQSGKSLASASRNAQHHRHSHLADPYIRGLLVFSPPATSEYMSLDELARAACRQELIYPRAKDANGAMTVCLHFSRQDEAYEHTLELDFRPDVNYLVSRAKYTLRFAKGTIINEDHVTEFTEPSRGVFFPKAVSGVTVSDGEPWAEYTTRISDIKVNQALPPGIFKLSFPAGVVLTDSVRRLSHKVDTAGNPVSAPYRYTSHPAPPTSTQSTDAEQKHETQAEPRSWSPMLMVISTMMLGAAALIAVIRRRRPPSGKDVQLRGGPL